MSSYIGFIRRNYTSFFPSQPSKFPDALQIGLLGASNIAPLAIIGPAKTHPDVVIAAVAARDEVRAKSYAKKHGIKTVWRSYQELIDDPSLNVIYIPLPNGLHYEWAIKSLQAGKHVLLEKPSVSNSTEAASLFNSPLLSGPNAPILLEAFHSLFHPAFQHFLTLLSPEKIETARVQMTAPFFLFPNDDIRFKYEISGGALMDFGTYAIMMLRHAFGTEPVECVEAEPRIMPEGFDQKADHAFRAKWKWPNGGIGELSADLAANVLSQGPGGWPKLGCPLFEVVHKEDAVPDDKLEDGKEHIVVKKLTMWNPMMSVHWHRIDVISTHSIRNISDGKVVKTWEEREYVKAYTWDGSEGEEGWSTYRHQLEQFVNKVRGKETRVWMSGENSIRQMEVIDSAYKKAGMDLRPTSSSYK